MRRQPEQCAHCRNAPERRCAAAQEQPLCKRPGQHAAQQTTGTHGRLGDGQSGVGKGIIADNQQRHTDSNRGYDSQIEQGQHRGQPEQRPCPEEKRFGWQTQA